MHRAGDPGLLVLWPKLTSAAALVALGAVALVTAALSRWMPGLHFETMASRFGGIPATPPTFACGLVALESAITKLQSQKARVVLSGVQTQPMRVLERAGLTSMPGTLQFASSMQEAAQQARLVLTPTSETPVVQPAATGGGAAPSTRPAGP